jgi:hypothetical protein
LKPTIRRPAPAAGRVADHDETPFIVSLILGPAWFQWSSEKDRRIKRRLKGEFFWTFFLSFFAAERR